MMTTRAVALHLRLPSAARRQGPTLLTQQMSAQRPTTTTTRLSEQLTLTTEAKYTQNRGFFAPSFLQAKV